MEPTKSELSAVTVPAKLTNFPARISLNISLNNLNRKSMGLFLAAKRDGKEHSRASALSSLRAAIGCLLAHVNTLRVLGRGFLFFFPLPLKENFSTKGGNGRGLDTTATALISPVGSNHYRHL